MTDLPHEISTAAQHVQDHYLKMLADGQSERFAMMCALQQAPGTKASDRAFMEGRLSGNWMDTLPKHQAQRMIRETRAAGISVAGKFYMSGLADKRGHLDPSAWVDSVDDIKKVARAKNLNVQGVVNIQASDTPAKRHALNPRLERELAQKEMAKSPGLKMGDAIEKVREKHTPRWKKKRT